MGKELYRTDYTAREVYARRASHAMQRGDKYMSSSGPIRIPFKSNFDEFAAAVAHELRHKIVYRTDGGKFARGLVRVSGDLQAIHEAYLKAAAPPSNGMLIHLSATFFRRKDPLPPNRWVMSIRFKAPDWIFEEDGDHIVANPSAVAKEWQTAMDNMLHHALSCPRDVSWGQGRRIFKMLNIADRLGYPRNADLWYYSPQVVVDYVNARGSSDKDRLMMTQGTNGRFPFDGHVPGRGGNWRQFPFRILAQRCALLDADHCHAVACQNLGQIDDQIVQVFAFIRQQSAQLSVGGDYGAGKLITPLIRQFLHHLDGLRNDADHLYSAYKDL